MTNRTEEYRAWVSELAQPPVQLRSSVERARKRARRSQILHRFTAPLGFVASIAACFVLMVNLFPSFALACSDVPIIRELAAVVAFSPSLSAAVAHDYVQYIGQSQTVDGVTVDLGYAIVDKHQAVFFYSVDGGQFWTSPTITAPNGEHIGGYATSNLDTDEGDGLETLTLSFTGGESTLPDRFTLELYFQPKPERDQVSEPVAPSASAPNHHQEWVNPRDDPNALRFTFDITLDPARTNMSKTVEVGQWLELDGQRIQVDRLELYPTRTIVYLGEDSANTAWLRSLKFYFTDGRGRVYDNIDGSLSASGETDSKSYLTYYFQSFYYGQPEHLTLYVTRAEWLDKDAPHVFLDLTTRECSGLPDGITVDEITRAGDSATVKLLSPLEHQGIGQIFGYTYWDPDGGEHQFNQWSSGSEWNNQNEQTAYYEKMYLEDYPWDTMELELNRTSVSVYDQPMRVTLRTD